MKNKASVAKALHEKGIPIPEEDSYSAMMHRLNTWCQGHGYLFRRMKTRFYAKHNLPLDIPIGEVVWVPNSNFARSLIKSGAMWPMGRAPYDEKYTIIDIPITKEMRDSYETAQKTAQKKQKVKPKKV